MFPDTYIGFTRGSDEIAKMRGNQKWHVEHRQSITRLEESLISLSESRQPNPRLKDQALFTCQLHLGLHYAWDGNWAKSSDLFRASATLADIYISHAVPTLTSDRAPDFAQVARDGAAAANLVDDDVLSQRLFRYAERFSAALVREDETRPVSQAASLQPWGYYPLIRAYSLIRLRRVDGSSAFLHDMPFPDAKQATPVWQQADIERLLMTIETSVAVGRAKREAVIWWNSEKYLLSLLRAIAGCLRAPDSEEARITAQKALKKYDNMIRNLADFSIIYLLVLDLQKAFPEIFTS